MKLNQKQIDAIRNYGFNHASTNTKLVEKVVQGIRHNLSKTK